MTKKKTINIKEFLDDDSLDLSLCDLQDVPVKEIASVPKATNVDLSNNKLAVLGNNFAVSLVHLVKLDLSGNQLTELPQNFGLLVNLKHLDLYKNKLQTLPLTFSNLRSLRWLDLKQNPLVPKMAQVAGTCLDQAECLAAARNIVRHMQLLQKELEEENQRKEKERLEKKLIEEQKALKKEQKLKRRKERKNEAKAAEWAKRNAELNGATVVEKVETVQQESVPVDEIAKKTSILGKIGPAFSLLFKITIIASLLTTITLFAISLLDETLYNKCVQRLSSFSKTIGWRIPPSLNRFVVSSSSLIALVAQDIFWSTIFIIRFSLATVADLYRSVVNDAVVSSIVQSINEYFYISYIKASEYSSIYYQKLVLLIQSYIKK